MEKKKKIIYDPQKEYSWNSDDIYEVTGGDIDAWNKALMILVNDPEYQKFLYIQRAAMKMNAFLKEAVEIGAIKEVQNGQTEPASTEASN